MSRVAWRAAAVELLEGYQAANPGALKQVYRARPMSITPPTAFVDAINQDEINYTPAGKQPQPLVVIRLVRGQFATGDVADANDALVDDFIDYVVANRHVAGGNTLSLITSATDDDGWIPDWMDPPPRPFYSTVLTLSGDGLVGGVV